MGSGPKLAGWLCVMVTRAGEARVPRCTLLEEEDLLCPLFPFLFSLRALHRMPFLGFRHA